MWLGPSKNINGTYKVIYDKEFKEHPNFVINFKDSVYVKIVNNSLILKGIVSFIDQGSGLAYLIDSKVTDSNRNQDSTSLSNMIQRSFGDLIMEIKMQDSHNIRFRTTYAANLHITVSTGILKKVK